MSFLMEYWNSIDIGRPELNHSQGFFRRTHSLHEKGADFPPKKMLQTQKSSVTAKKQTATTANVPKQNKTSNKENVPINKAAQNQQQQQQQQQQKQPNRAILAVSIVKKTQSTAVNSSKPATATQQKNVLKKSSSVSSSSTNIAKNNDKKVLTKSQSHQKLATTTDKLYEQAEIQKKRKEVLAKKIKAEEEKELKFKFHAKPVPKFVKTAPSLQTIIKQQQISKQNAEEKKKTMVKQQSMPNIPHICKKNSVAGTLVPSCGDPERIKVMQEHKRQLMEKYKPENVQFKAKPASVLQKTVFQPKHNFKTLDAKPFKLVLTQRMMQRSTFDKQLHEAQAIKEKQKEILLRQHELEERKMIRQNAEFKARPNPFGRY